MKPTFSGNFWRSLFVCFILEALVFWGCASCYGGCKKETSTEGRASSALPKCVYFKLIAVETDAQGHYAYNADLFSATDTTREVLQANIIQADSNFYKTKIGTVICEFSIDSLSFIHL